MYIDMQLCLRYVLTQKYILYIFILKIVVNLG